MKQIFGTANKIQCDDEKTDAHAAEIENWNVDYDMNWVTTTSDVIKKMRQTEAKRRKQQITYVMKLDALTKE